MFKHLNHIQISLSEIRDGNSVLSFFLFRGKNKVFVWLSGFFIFKWFGELFV